MKFGADYVLFCHITTQIQGEKHGNLLSERGGNGFPHIVFMDSEGALIAVHEGARSAEEFAKTGGKAKAFLDLKKRAEGGDAAAKAGLIIARLELRQLKAGEAREQIKGVTFTPAQQSKLDGLLNDAAIREILEGLKTRDKAAMLAVGKKFYEHMKAGKPAPTGDSEIQAYWILMMDYAESRQDAGTFEVALAGLRGKFGAVASAKPFFDKKEAILKQLKEGAAAPPK